MLYTPATRYLSCPNIRLSTTLLRQPHSILPCHKAMTCLDDMTSVGPVIADSSSRKTERLREEHFTRQETFRLGARINVLRTWGALAEIPVSTRRWAVSLQRLRINIFVTSRILSADASVNARCLYWPSNCRILGRGWFLVQSKYCYKCAMCVMVQPNVGEVVKQLEILAQRLPSPS
jgi:hypothetical protein